MGIVILFRKTYGDRPFGKAIDSLVSLKGEELILTSGYTTINKPSFLTEINKGFSGNTSTKLITLAGSFDSTCNKASGCTCHYHKYIEFTSNYLCNCVATNKEFYIDRKGNWHAKVYIKKRSNEPIAMLIGSSNLSMPAYGKGYRQECDVFLWEDSISKELNWVDDLPESEGFRVNPFYEGQETKLMKKQEEEVKSYISDKDKVNRILLK